MKKILILGSGGAGKSTLAKRLHKATGVEIIHLDKLYWKPNWVKTSKDAWQKIIEEILKGDSWILDGNYTGTLPTRVETCDTVIFLDVPRVVCMYRILKRAAFYHKKNRPDMAAGCYERFDWDFVKWVWNYPQHTKPQIEILLKRFGEGKSIIRLKSKTDVENFFMNLESHKIKFA